MSQIIFVIASIILLSILIDLIIKNRLSFKYKVISMIALGVICSGLGRLALL